MLLLSTLLLTIALVGCGGSGSTETLAGSYQGSWMNVADATDVGTSTWTISPNGQINGTDVDGPDDSSYTVSGQIDGLGNVNATTSLVGGNETIPLTGRLERDSQGRLTGDLVWASNPPSTYRYTFNRQ